MTEENQKNEIILLHKNVGVTALNQQDVKINTTVTGCRYEMKLFFVSYLEVNKYIAGKSCFAGVQPLV